MDTVVEILFDKLHLETQSLWMEKWKDIEKAQMFIFYVKGYGLHKIDFPGETPFTSDPQRYEFLRESFEIYYNEVFKKT